MVVEIIFSSTGRDKKPKIIKVKNEEDIFKYIEQYNLNIDKYNYHYCSRQIRVIDFKIL